MHSREAVTAFLRASHVPDKALRVMATNFNEDEQANAAHTTAAAESKTTSFAGVEVYRYSSSGDRRSWADFDEATAIRSFQDKDGVAVLLRNAAQRTLGTPIWQGSEWAWYTKPARKP